MMVIMRKLLTKLLNILDGKNKITIIFKNGGGGGVKVCYLRHYMKKYRAIRLLGISVRTLNVIICARYVFVWNDKC